MCFALPFHNAKPKKWHVSYTQRLAGLFSLAGFPRPIIAASDIQQSGKGQLFEKKANSRCLSPLPI